jgi:hypothetical protein
MSREHLQGCIPSLTMSPWLSSSLAVKTSYLSLLVCAFACAAAEPSDDVTNEVLDGERLKQMVHSLHERGFTNLAEADLRRDFSVWITNMFTVHAGLPVRIADWPAPQLSDTNRLVQIRGFIEKHGWEMYDGERFIIGMGVQTQPIRGLPWMEIAERTFPAVTHDGILYVVLMGFGPESGGVAWNPSTNRFDSMINGFKPLGGGWYYWKQTMSPSQPGDRIYEDETSKTGQQDGAANRSQSIRAETNRTSVTAGSDR